MTAALALLGVLAAAGVGYALGRVDLRDRISELEKANESLSAAYKALMDRALRSASRFTPPPRPPAPAPQPRLPEPAARPDEPPLEALPTVDPATTAEGAESATQAVPEPTGEPQTEPWSVPQ